MLTPAARATAWQRRAAPATVVHVADAADRPSADASRAAGATTTWHFVAADVRDFAWGTSDQYVWDATRALVADTGARLRDTVDINSFFR